MSELTEMEKYLQKLFTEAGQDLKKKFLKYTQDFQRLDAAKQQAVENGNITEDEYKEWRKNKLLYGMHWQRLIDRNTAELLKYNQTAIKYINGEVPQIFASGYNKVAEQIPDSPVAGFDFELINADTVNNLVHEDGIILPPKKKVDPEKDKAWNAKLINAQLLQGIMQGESIPDMAKRMMTVANSDLAGATRTARTMHTAAQNAGRQSGYNKAAQQGIIFEKTWISARQINVTRDTHYALHGTTVPYNEMFVTDADNELEFPGDWRAPGEEVYNCRCTMITKFVGFKKLNGEEPEGTRHEEESTQKSETKSMIPSLNSILEACTTEREISKAAQEYFIAKEGCKIESVDLLRVDPEVARQMVVKIDELDNKYHSSLTEIKARAISDGIGGVTKPNEQSCYEYIKTNDSSVLKSTITLNNKLCKDQNIVKQVFNVDNRSSGGLAHGAWVDEDNAALATLVHEYGHTILAGKLNEIAVGMGVENEAYEEAKQVYNDYISELRKIKREMQDVRFKYAGQPDGLRKGNEAAQELQNKYNSTSISKYSESSVGEMIAEAFCDAQLSSNPREYSKRIMKILDREYGK